MPRGRPRGSLTSASYPRTCRDPRELQRCGRRGQEVSRPTTNVVQVQPDPRWPQPPPARPGPAPCQAQAYRWL